MVTKRWKKGFLGWFHWERTEWDTNTGTAQQYVGSVKADHGIGIGFLGNQDGNSSIKVTSKADVALTGKIQSSRSGIGSTISIISQEGAIDQSGGLLKRDNIKLSARKGLNNIAIESLGDTVKLDAANTGSGNMNITVDGAYGKAGHVDLVQAKNTNGDVSLTVLGNLTQNGTTAAVKGNRLDLVSQQGSIGTDTTALKVETPDTAVDALNPLSSSVNVTAKGNIHVAEDVAAYRAGVQSEFTQYLKLKAVYEKDEEAAEAGQIDANYQVLKDRYGAYASADDYLAKSDTAKNHLAELQKAGAGWTENELLYAISDAIVNKAQGSTDTELKEANISGQNITLHAKNIGSDKAAEDVLVKDITTDERLDDLKKVVNANLTGKNLILEGGSADIGAADKQIAVDLTGSLSALTDGSMYISSVGSHDLQLTGLYAGKDMVLESQQDITMSPDALAQAYLNAGSLLNLKAQGGIGTEDNALRILGNGAVVDAEAQESSIYLAGKKKTGETDGLLLLGSVKTNPGHAVAVTAETNLSLGKKDDAATLDSQVSADTVSLSSDKDIDLVKGGLTANALDLKAGGSISQSAAHAITAPTVKLDAVSGIDLVSGAELDKNKVFNDFQNVRVKNGSDAADVTIGSGGSKNLTVSFEIGTKGNNVTVHNYQNGAVNDMTVNGPLQAAGSIHLMNAEADLMTAGSLEAVKGDAKVVSESGEILVNGRYVGYSKSDGRQRLHRRFGRCERWRHDPFGNRPQSPGQ
ncbi:hypothetical protein [Megasphaera sp.]|uniref:hypothetical protein n=1 Tax=Megasphaera sp. TaxID=2023260 RepID=UPI00352184AD